MTRMARDVDHWVRLYEGGHADYRTTVQALADHGCGDEDIARLIGPDPDTGGAPRARFVPLGV